MKRIFFLTALIVVSLFIGVWCATYGYQLFLNKLTFRTFTGKTEQVVSNPIVFQSIGKEILLLSDFKGKYVVLDFWSSTCGVCIEKFPKTQKLYEKYNDNPSVIVYSVFCRIDKKGETVQIGSQILTERGYTFPVLSIDMNDPALKEIGVTAFPTVIVFDMDGKLIFRGHIENALKYLVELTGD